MNPSVEDSTLGGELQGASLTLSPADALRGSKALWNAVGGLLRERHARVRRLPAAPRSERDGVEAEVLGFLYGDARARHRTYDTQPSHIRPMSTGVRGSRPAR